MTQYIDPTLLGITPPMDLGRTSELVPPSLPADKLSQFPLKLRDYIGQFGIRRRDIDWDLIRLHDGVDLLAPIGTPVFAAQAGRIVYASGKHVRIEHIEGFRYITAYTEIRNTFLNIYKRDADGDVIVDGEGVPAIDYVLSPDDMVGRMVRQGERIAEVKDFSGSNDHLHFEIRYPFSNSGNNREVTLSVDPTWALYAWEKKMYPNDRTTRHVVPAGLIQDISEIVHARLLRFLKIKVEGFGRNIYFPLGHMDDADKCMVDTLRTAFFSNKQVEIVWRNSLFFNQIEFSNTSMEKVPVLAEIKVLAP